eukprot:IDg4518t1
MCWSPHDEEITVIVHLSRASEVLCAQSVMSTTGTSAIASKVMGPGAIEVPKLIGQENVFLWRRRAKAALKAREIWAAVTAPSIGADNGKAVGLIIASPSDQVLCMLSEEDSAHAMWNELDGLYATRDAGRVILVEEQIFGAKMAASDSAESRIATMKQAVFETR